MNNMNESEQWLIEQARSALFMGKPEQEPMLEEVRRFTKSFWPFMEPYFSPLHPAFSFELQRSERMQQQKIWMLRDGLIPLTMFFENTTRELAAMSRILVHASLGAIVPPYWKKSTKYYDLFSENTYHAANMPGTLIITGAVNPGITSLNEIDPILDQAVETLGGKSVDQVLIYCPVRHTEHIRPEEESFEFQFYHRIFSRFGAQARFVHWQTLEHATFKNTAVMEVNAGWFYRDSSMIHHLLRRGAGLLRAPRSQAKAEARTRLSPHHGVEVTAIPETHDFRKVKEADRILELYSTLYQKMNESRSVCPWPKWYQNFSRAAYRRDFSVRN